MAANNIIFVINKFEDHFFSMNHFPIKCLCKMSPNVLFCAKRATYFGLVTMTYEKILTFEKLKQEYWCFKCTTESYLILKYFLISVVLKDKSTGL